MIRHNSFTQAILGLGANLSLGDQSIRSTLESALAELASEDILVQKVSRFYATPCFPAGAGPDYVNAAALLATRLSPQDVLSRFHEIEESHGRVRKERWGGRVLDLDLLAWGARVMPDANTFRRWQTLPSERQKEQAPEQLILPHPRLQDRAFVLVPMHDVAPDWQHPVSGRTVTQMLADLSSEERNAVRAL